LGKSVSGVLRAAADVFEKTWRAFIIRISAPE
jgi:hypothetical protein